MLKQVDSDSEQKVYYNSRRGNSKPNFLLYIVRSVMGPVNGPGALNSIEGTGT